MSNPRHTCPVHHPVAAQPGIQPQTNKGNEGVIHLPNLDGVEIQPGVVVIGEVTPIPDTNLLRALANVAGALCVVELRVCFKMPEVEVEVLGAPPVDFIEFDLGENIPPIKVLRDCANQPQPKVDIPLANPIEGE